MVCQKTLDMSGFQGFPNSAKRWGERPTPLVEGEWEILLGVDFFLSGGGHLRRIAFDHSNLFQGKKHPSVNKLKFEHQLKSKLARPSYVYKEYEVKIKMVQEQWLQLKMKFLLVYYIKIFI